MALTIKFKVQRNADFKSVAVSDNGTAWGIDGNMGKDDVTGISLYVYGLDKVNPLHVIEFSAGEISSFLGGVSVAISFIDSRLFATVYAPDNFYTCKLSVDGGETIETLEAFDSYFYLKKIMITDISSVSVPVDTYLNANGRITGVLTGMMQLDYLSSIIDVARENKWRKVYDFLKWNYKL